MVNIAYTPASPSSPGPPPSPETQEATVARAAKADGIETNDGQTEDQTPLLFSRLTVGWRFSEHDLLPLGPRTEAV